MGLLDKMRSSFSKDSSVEEAQEKPRPYQVTFEDPGPHAVTCPIRFDRAVSPGGTSLFETPAEAAAWPAAEVAALCERHGPAPKLDLTPS